MLAEAGESGKGTRGRCQDELLYRSRACGIEHGKAELYAITGCHLTEPGAAGVGDAGFATTKRGVLELADGCAAGRCPYGDEVSRDYCKGPFDRGGRGPRMRAGRRQEVKNLPGRPKREFVGLSLAAACFQRGAVTACFVAARSSG